MGWGTPHTPPPDPGKGNFAEKGKAVSCYQPTLTAALGGGGLADKGEEGESSTSTPTPASCYALVLCP